MTEQSGPSSVVRLARWQRRHAEGISLERTPVVAIHKPGDQVLDLRQTLLSVHSDEFVDTLISPSGEWQYYVEEHLNPYDMQPRELLARFMDDLEPVYEAVSLSLDALKPYGYNRHDRQHAEKVGETGLYLLEAGGYDLSVQRRFAAAAAAHDLGNLLSRFSQSVLAPQVFHGLYPNLAFSKMDWAKIERAVKRHEEDVANGLNESNQRHTDPLSLDKRSSYMLKQFGPEGVALIASDKMHIGRDRLSAKAIHPEAVDADSHTATNLLLGTTHTEAKGDKFIWRLDFNPEINETELPKLRGLALPHSSRNGYKAYVSRHTHELYRSEGKPHFKSTVENFFEIYSGRVALTVESIFALLPGIDVFEMGFTDQSAASGFVFNASASITRYGRDGFSDKILSYLATLQNTPHFHTSRKELRRT